MTDAPSPGAALPDFDDPRWRGSRGPQLAGRPCADCGKKITVALEAAQCELCGEATHEACLAEHRAHAHAPEGGGPFR